MIGKQSVVAITQRSFHPGKQTLKISQGIVGEGEYALRILCMYKIRYVLSIYSVLGVFFFLV